MLDGIEPDLALTNLCVWTPLHHGEPPQYRIPNWLKVQVPGALALLYITNDSSCLRRCTTAGRNTNCQTISLESLRAKVSGFARVVRR